MKGACGRRRLQSAENVCHRKIDITTWYLFSWSHRDACASIVIDLPPFWKRMPVMMQIVKTSRRADANRTINWNKSQRVGRNKLVASSLLVHCRDRIIYFCVLACIIRARRNCTYMHSISLSPQRIYPAEQYISIFLGLIQSAGMHFAVDGSCF
jgi:hypothetical protein